jgi:HSP20 family molecular chaperone IbpA
MSGLLPERRSRLAAEPGESFSEVEQVSERLRRMLDQSFGGLAPSFQTEQGGWSPLVDIEEADDAYVIEAEPPRRQGEGRQHRAGRE